MAQESPAVVSDPQSEALLRAALRAALRHLTADLSAVYYCQDSEPLLLVSEGRADLLPLPRELYQQAEQALGETLRRTVHSGHGEPFVLAQDLPPGVEALLVIPLLLDKRIIGALVLLSSKAGQFMPAHAQEIREQAALAQTIVQNIALRQKMQAEHRVVELLQSQQDIVLHGRIALLDAMTDGVVIVLPHQDTSRVLTVNARFTTFFGVSESEAENLTLDKLIDALRIPRSTRQELALAWQPLQAYGLQVAEGEIVIPGQSGAHLDIHWYSGPIRQGERVLGRVYTFHDVTSENAAARLRSAWLSRVSHELRTPLTSISGFAQFILEAAGDDLPDIAREYTEIILNSARHLNRVFTGMIEISRADAGELALHLSEAHLPDVIIESVARLEFQSKERELKMVMDLDDDLPHVRIDIDRVAQVMTNLLTNAMKHTPVKSRIRIATRYIKAHDALPASAPHDTICPCVLVSVIDQGLGLTKEEAEKVFEPFFRTGYARAHMVEGSGLGLALSRSFVEAHRGKIWAEAATKRRGQGGGRFFFTLPC
ncbi:MAG: PAS domain-containing protein [Chloroflexi bacterium]|nr:PAS domain-containing protein [Chloroflexota bacterium]